MDWWLTRTLALIGMFCLAACSTNTPRATPVIPPTAEDREQRTWASRFLNAVLTHELASQTSCLTHIAQNWPASLHTLPYRAVMQTAYSADNLPDRAARFALLQALFNAQYVPDDGIGLDELWRDLALARLERGESDAAATALARVTSPFVLLSVRIDNRFSGIRERLGAHLDIDAAMTAELSSWRARVQTHPNELRSVERLAELLVAAQRSVEALPLLDSAIAQVHAHSQGRPAYIDQGSEYNWILEWRSRALFQQSRIDEAVAQERMASQTTEHGYANVSQTINLSSLYNDVGRPRDALAALAIFPERGSSSNGYMQIEFERLRAALQLRDETQVAQTLAYLQAHCDDAVGTLQFALIYADHSQEAAELYIARLADPRRRIAALLEAQNYPGSSITPTLAAEGDRWQTFLALPAVQAAIAKVGVVETFDIASR